MKAIILEEMSQYPDVTVFSGTKDFAPHILTFGIKGVRGEVIVHAFEEYEIYISTTSACSSKAGKPAGTLIAMGVPSKLATTAVRLSLDADNDMSQVEQFLTTFKIIYEKTRKVRFPPGRKIKTTQFPHFRRGGKSKTAKNNASATAER